MHADHLPTETIVAKLDLKGFLRALYALTKPTITLLVVVTAVPGLLLASPTLPSLTVVLAALIGTGLSSASAAVFNQVIDARIDSHMKRTMGRPLPLGRISAKLAVAYGLLLGFAGSAILCAFASPMAAGVAVAANLFYVIVYTLILKRITVQNIVIGGAAGAVGPLIGWSAITNTLPFEAWLMFLLIFLWTPPHFWALAIKYKDDYARARIPMLPVIKGDAVTRRDIFLYSLTLLPNVWLFYHYGMVGLVALSLNLLLTAGFVYKAFKLFRSGDNTFAMPVFHYSCLYLFGIFGVISIDRVVGYFLI